MYPDCGNVQSQAEFPSADLGTTGNANTSFERADPLSRSYAAGGFNGPGFTPSISVYSYSALGDRIIASAIGLQRYVFLTDAPLTGQATLTYSQTGTEAGNPNRTPSGFLRSGIITFRTDDGQFDPANCGIGDPSAGVAILGCLIREEYTGGSDFVNNEFDADFSQNSAASQTIPFSVGGGAGAVVFLSADVFIFANNGGFGDSRTTLTIELDNPEVVEATFADDTFEPAPQPVEIDIRPFSDDNQVWPRSWGFLPVAILGSQYFDALLIKKQSVRFGPNETRPVPWFSYPADVNHDGYTDHTLLFRTRRTGIRCGDVEAMISGDTFVGDSFTGIDTISTAHCH